MRTQTTTLAPTHNHTSARMRTCIFGKRAWKTFAKHTPRLLFVHIWQTVVYICTSCWRGVMRMICLWSPDQQYQGVHRCCFHCFIYIYIYIHTFWSSATNLTCLMFCVRLCTIDTHNFFCFWEKSKWPETWNMWFPSIHAYTHLESHVHNL